jgi:predicted amidohydrolase YtcJ
MLIRNAELEDGRICNVRIDRDRIVAIGQIAAHDGEAVFDADGGLLLPGLHDHHIHVAALAAAQASVRCGPPEVDGPDAFAAALRTAGNGWLRATGYHESVAGMLDVAALDRITVDRPVRVQHRSGRMWFFNSPGLDAILANRSAPPGLERVDGAYTGRLFDEDDWLRATLGSAPPAFAAIGTLLARFGVTGLTDMSPGNGPVIARHFAAERASGSLPQHVLLAGGFDLVDTAMPGRISLGAAKLHLHEADLPAFDDVIAFIHRAHALGRVVAVHCATEVELIYTLAAFAEAGAAPGDRIEHASVTPDAALADIARLGLMVVTQPHFIFERGDIYRTDVESRDQPFLYRLRAFLDAGITMAAGSDAPFGGADPWTAMAAAVSRSTREGATIGLSEAIAPESALDLYLKDPENLGQRRRVAMGARADLCLLDRPWASARAALSPDLVRATFIDGRLVFDRVDQPPSQRGFRVDPPA